jgi:hypothetical protein
MSYQEKTAKELDLINGDLMSRARHGCLYGLTQKGYFNLDSERSHPSCAYEPLKVTNLCVHNSNKIEVELESIHHDYTIGLIESDEVMPYLFSFDDIVKPIQIKEVNNGEPFIPIEELLKTTYPDHWAKHKDDIYGLIVRDSNPFVSTACFKNHATLEVTVRRYEVNNCPKIVSDFFIKHHINYQLTKELFIPVTDILEFNPYMI